MGRPRKKQVRQWGGRGRKRVWRDWRGITRLSGRCVLDVQAEDAELSGPGPRCTGRVEGIGWWLKPQGT